MSLGISFCCSWVCWGQFRQFRAASGCAPGFDFLFPLTLTSVMMTELLEGSLWFQCSLILDEGWLPNSSLVEKDFHESHITPFSSFCCQLLAHGAVSEPASSPVAPGTPTSVPVTWLSTRHYLIMSFFCRIWFLDLHELVQQEQMILTSPHKWHKHMEDHEWVLWTRFVTILLRVHMRSNSSLAPWRDSEETMSYPQSHQLFFFPPTGNIQEKT